MPFVPHALHLSVAFHGYCNTPTLSNAPPTWLRGLRLHIRFVLDLFE